MSKRKSDGSAGLVIVFILVLAFLAGCVVFGIHTYTKVSRQSKADEATLKAWTEVWGNGESVTGIVVKTKDKAVRDCYELRYTVDGTDYAVVCTLNAKTFAAIDGDDEDGPDSSKDNIVDEATKTGGVLGRGLGVILNAAAAGAESFEKGLSEEIEENEES